jgi:hypothetical protein
MPRGAIAGRKTSFDGSPGHVLFVELPGRGATQALSLSRLLAEQRLALD